MKTKCAYCGADGPNTFVPRQEGYSPSFDPKPSPDDSPLVVGVVLCLIGLTLCVIGGLSIYHYFVDESTIRASLEQQYKNECWIAGIQKDLNLPKATDEELWCQAHGHCGPAREGLAAELGNCLTELEKIGPQYDQALKDLKESQRNEKWSDDAWVALNKDLEFYAEKSIEVVCAEDMAEMEDHFGILQDLRGDAQRESHVYDIKLMYLNEKYNVSVTEATALMWWNEED